jgi:hypothetical protein
MTRFAEDLIISFSGAQTVVRLEEQPIDSYATDLFLNAGEEVDVDLQLIYRAPVTAALADLLDFGLTARGVMHVE